MNKISIITPENKRQDGHRLFIGFDGRARVCYPGRGGWRFASPTDLAMPPWPFVAVDRFRGDE